VIKALSRSLSLRLLGIFIVTAVLIVIVLVALFSRSLNSQWGRSIQPHLLQYVQYVQQDLGSPPDPKRAELLAKKLPVAIHIFNGEEFVFSTSGNQLDLDKYRFKSIPISNNKSYRQQDSRTKPSRPLNAAISIHDQPNGRILRIEQDGYSVYYDLHRQWNRRGPHGRYGDELVFALLALALVLGASYYVIRRQLAPISQIQHNVGRMAIGELEHRINRAGHSDLDELANSIDGMAARLQAMLDAKRQLLMAISHELRSPLTRARVATELLPESRNRERIEEDLRDMERMITDIMESEQLQTNHTALNLEQLNILSLAQKEIKAISPSTPVTISKAHMNEPRSSATSQPVFIQGDAVRLRILLRNLVSNALRHGKNAQGIAQVDVKLLNTHDTVQIQVSDQGPGIPRDHLAAVTEPFYRPDASRNRNTGGFGLGLTLANLIAKAHGGSLEIDSDPETLPGTRVTVTLPRSQPSDS
jgi:signal transduction histidine kinase